jgi:hypothetical protein
MKPQLHILFTLNCEPPRTKVNPEAPKTWEFGCRAMEGFCTRVFRAGYTPTLFAASECIEEQQPFFEDMAQRGAEIGLLLHPPQIGDGRFTKCLGQYPAEDQRTFIDYAAEKCADRLGSRPQSFRGGLFSANDATYRVLFDLGFRQGSLSEPGRQIARFESDWAGAPHDAHYVDAEQKKQTGSLPFLELPVTTDLRGEVVKGVPLTLQLAMGTFDALLKPTIEYALERMDREQTAFRMLCIAGANRFDYYGEQDPASESLEALLDYLEELGNTYTLVPVTAAMAHGQYRTIQRTQHNAGT